MKIGYLMAATSHTSLEIHSKIPDIPARFLRYTP